MSHSRWIRPLVVGLSLATAAFGSEAALAHGGGGFRGGFAHGGVAHYGIPHVSGYRGGYVSRGFPGGYYRGYAPARSYYGGGYAPLWGVLGLGLFISTLPRYHSTYYWNGDPYYYADGYYYRYDGSLRQYERVTLPAKATASAQQAPVSTELFVYPKNGQSDEQVARDRAECLQWADQQDAPAAGTGVSPPPMSAAQSMRAQSACLEGRGYTVR